MNDPPRPVELLPDRLGEREVGCVVAVEMTEFPLSDPERELAAPTRARLDPRPRQGLLGDLLAWCLEHVLMVPGAEPGFQGQLVVRPGLRGVRRGGRDRSAAADGVDDGLRVGR